MLRGHPEKLPHFVFATNYMEALWAWPCKQSRLAALTVCWWLFLAAKLDTSSYFISTEAGNCFGPLNLNG